MPSRRVFLRVLVVCALGAQCEIAAAFSQDLPAPEAWAALDRGDAAKAAAIFREELDRSPRNAML